MRKFTGPVKAEPHLAGFRLVLKQPTGESVFRDLSAEEAAALREQLGANEGNTGGR